jgi:uncharacterized protein YndB with AHSA1/START domain
MDAIEAAYLAFRRRLRSIQGATACTCQACGLAPKLDLKLFLHHGAYVRGKISGRDELAGPSVILVHRLLKGGIASAAHDADGGARGFAVVTAEALAALGVAADDLGATEAHEAIEPFGDVTAYRLDLEGRWQTEQERRRIEIGAERAALDLRVDVPADPAEVWALLTSPALRATWEGAIVMLDDPDAPRGVGTTARCVTGRLATLEEIVDWQPYDHIGYRLAVPDVGPMEASIDLEPGAGGGTSVRLCWAVDPGADVDPKRIERLRIERAGALERLAAVAGRGSTTRSVMEV